MKRFLIPLVILILLVAGAFWFYRSSRPWTAFGPDAQSIGKYHTIEECQRAVGKTGGWCGKECKDDGVECAPLVPVPKQ
jgi:hypothetical protein